MTKLSHTDEKGRARMVDVGHKDVQRRTARASGHIRLAPETVKLINENSLKKGDVLTVAQLAGIQSAKNTSGLIPLCHNIGLDSIHVELKTDNTGVVASSKVECTGKTGAEMEALTAVSLALLTVYDMCKAVDKDMEIDTVKLVEKNKYDIT